MVIFFTFCKKDLKVEKIHCTGNFLENFELRLLPICALPIYNIKKQTILKIGIKLGLVHERKAIYITSYSVNIPM